MNKIIKNIYIKYLQFRLFWLSDTLKNAVYLDLTRKEKDEEKQRRLIMEIMNAMRNL